MKYAFLFYVEDRVWEEMPKKDEEAIKAESAGYDARLMDEGHLIIAQALQSIQSSTTLRVRSEKVLLTDGPFAETKEQLCGFVLAEARDLNEALSLASRSPLARLGSVEVRPCMGTAG
jgi:hypothetical protein